MKPRKIDIGGGEHKLASKQTVEAEAETV
jgi:hypothetical protein